MGEGASEASALRRFTLMHVLAVSPHLDDAVFSAGGRLARHAAGGDAVTVLTCFTGNVGRPSGFALACQLDKGLGPEIDYMALRRAEDRAACAAIGAEPLHWPLLEAPHRGYDSAKALFGPTRDDDAIEDALADRLTDLLEQIAPDRVYGPFGVGGHVDHRKVRAALERAAPQTVWWEDYPYAMREPAPPPGIVREPLALAEAEAKLAAVLAYESQLDFQFGGRDQAREALARWRVEGFAGSTA